MGHIGYYYGSELSKQFEHGQVMEFMGQVSDLTSENAPHTVPKTPEELESTLAHSILALHVMCDDYSVAGHVTAVPLFDGFVHRLGDEDKAPIYRTSVLKVASLVVDDAFEGNGHAKKMLGMLVQKLQPTTLQEPEQPSRMNPRNRTFYLPANLVTVTSCPAVFEKCGFVYGEYGVQTPNQAWQDRLAEVQHMKRKWVMSKAMGDVTDYSVVHRSGRSGR